MSKIFRAVFIAALSFAFVTGCASVGRTMGKVTSNKYAEPRSGTTWITAPPQLEPPAASDRTVYISYRNISDAQNIQLLDTMKTAAQNQGWMIVNDPSKAKYRLRTSLRYFGEVQPESGGRTVAAGLGGITGAAGALATGLAIANAFNSNLAGVAGGLTAGGLIGAGIKNASKPREWALILDVVLEEYSATPVTYTMNRGTNSNTSSGAASGTYGGYTGGGQNNTNTSSATMTKTSHYYPHGIRLSAWANQMAMKQEEAMPHIISRTEQVITQMLPM